MDAGDISTYCRVSKYWPPEMYSTYVKHASQFPALFLNVQNYGGAELCRGDADAPGEEGGHLDLPFARARELSY
jgi:hypothetical protein